MDFGDKIIAVYIPYKANLKKIRIIDSFSIWLYWLYYPRIIVEISDLWLHNNSEYSSSLDLDNRINTTSDFSWYNQAPAPVVLNALEKSLTLVLWLTVLDEVWHQVDSSLSNVIDYWNIISKLLQLSKFSK